MSIFERLPAALAILILAACAAPTDDDDDDDDDVEPISALESTQSELSVAATTRILLLGDSITQGTNELQSYRYPFWKKLVAGDHAFDLVGNVDTNHRGNPSFPSFEGQAFDRDNEGHYGWRADEVLAKLPSFLVTIDKPDVVVLNIGSNDLRDREPFAKIDADIEGIVDRLRAAKADVKVFITNLQPNTIGRDHLGLGREVPKIVARKSTSSSPVEMIDTYSGFSTSWLHDGVHPSKPGEEHIASRVYAAIRDVVAKRVAPSGPTIGLGRTEAEDLSLTNYKPGARADASERTFVQTGGTGSIRGTFAGTAGKRTLSLRYLDESDGAATFTVVVDGKTITSFRASATPKGGTDGWASRNISVTLANGSTIEIRGKKDGGEYARIDCLDVK